MKIELKAKLFEIDNDPQAKWCGFCGKENDFFDDIGAFYIRPYKDVGVCCRSCWLGTPGELHRSKFGLGER